MKHRLKQDMFDIIQKQIGILKSPKAIAEEFYVNSQEEMIRLGTEIEYWEGEGTRTVSCMEQYCEQLYMGTIENSKREQTRKDLLHHLEELKSVFEEELASKREVVFFPYHASMWSSLASVWEEARKDNSCHVHVVPIPYFDKKEDGTYVDMHYEGDKFPPEVEITSWKEYDMKEWQPDLVFIHNPYDHGNSLTSVHPDYYSRELKKYAKTLVYIPYFLCREERVREDKVLTPSVLWVDYVIIQSQKCCDNYIRIYDRFLRENGLQGKVKPGKEKFLPLGSPIVDEAGKAVDWENVPEEWKRIIGENRKKKVLLYNTHLRNVTKERAEQFFHKLYFVFEKMKEREDIVLLWRPHPLTKQAIQVYYPDIAERYQAIIQEYREAGFGIYDDTSDLSRAIQLADAYYGDDSSLVTMFLEAGKPIMLQELEF